MHRSRMMIIDEVKVGGLSEVSEVQASCWTIKVSNSCDATVEASAVPTRRGTHAESVVRVMSHAYGAIACNTAWRGPSTCMRRSLSTALGESYCSAWAHCRDNHEEL